MQLKQVAFIPLFTSQFTILIKCHCLLDTTLRIQSTTSCYPPLSEASREVSNLTERKNPHNTVYGVKNVSVCLSVTNFDPNYFMTGKTEWAKKN